MDYDIQSAFARIENELIFSMIRNLDKHRAWEEEEGVAWEQWQTLQLKTLEQYRRDNKAKFTKEFDHINKNLEEAIRMARERGNTEQELKILEQIKSGKFNPLRKRKSSIQTSAEFFRLNDRKIEALIKATTNDLQKAEYAMLRMSNDKYRKIIFQAQVYANTGAGTYEKAVDMATRDFLAAGINCVEYKNGARHTVKEYADMTIRTATKRAYLTGEGEKRQEWGIHTVIMTKRGNPCPLCLPWVGKVLIDDVWSGGASKDGKYPLMSTAMAAGLYHPRCKDSHSTYFPGITEAEDNFTRKEIAEIEEENRQEAKKNYARRQAEKLERLSKGSLDEENQKRYALRREEWYKKHRDILQTNESGFDKSKARSEINRLRHTKIKYEEILGNLNKEEKELTQKVYFELNGSKADADRLKDIIAHRKEAESKIEELKRGITDKQNIYKSEAEKRLLQNGVIEEIKLSKQMTPETVDELENTLTVLKEKYGIMPKGIIYNPKKVTDATATYNWIEDTIYVSNRFNDSKEYFENIIRKSEDSLVEYNEHHGIFDIAKERLERVEEVLADKTIKGYERQKALIEKAEAEIQLNSTRTAVRENLMDALKHEYGHFIHRHAGDYIQKKNIYGMKELGGRFISGDWVYDVYTKDTRIGKVNASRISRYAAENPYEAFAEGFLAMEKGETIPDEIAEVINQAKIRAGAKTEIRNSHNVVDFKFKNLERTGNTTKEKMVVMRAMANTSEKITAAMKDTVVMIGGSRSGYDYTRDIMYIAKGAEEREIHHEIGHLIDVKLIDRTKVEQLKEKMFKDTTMADIIQETMYDTGGNPVEVLLVKNDNLISEYQGRIYIDDMKYALDKSGKLRTDRLLEFVSESYREYMEHGEKLKQMNRELYDLIEETIK
ncbi:MAG: phage minor capsid protein [Emergencia sp.]|nr:phage minor capsid protein [Emergencia sp.]